jgi:ethanolamine utilization protein EutL
VTPLGLRIEPAPKWLVPLPAKLLACRQIDRLDPQLAAAFKVSPEYPALGLVTCDSDDALYVALDHATKAAEVEVVFGRSFYAGARHASGPFSGEALGLLGSASQEDIAEALWALREGLADGIQFHTFESKAGEPQPAFFAHVIAETGRYLSAQAGLPAGAPMAYLIAPPLESVVGLDAALKAARVKLVKHFPPPSETNFGGGYLSGELPEVEAAAVAFVEAIRNVAAAPLSALRRPERLRR